MSADNQVVIQKRGNGKYWVWHQFVSNDHHMPERDDRQFDTLEDATSFAVTLESKLGMVEYGIAKYHDTDDNTVVVWTDGADPRAEEL